MEKVIQSQNQMIKEALIRGERITQLDALNRFGCFRLSGRIYDLRDEGLNIVCENKKLPNGKKIGEYYIPRENLHQGELSL